jgi:hypothetical protein
MNYGRAFSYVFEDPDWLKKVGIAALLSLTIIGLIPVFGWSLEVTRRIINGEPDLLPDWSNFSDFLSKGFQGVVIYFVYVLPAIIINSCANVIPAIISSMEGDTAQTMAMVFSIVSICLGCVVFVYSVAAGLVLPAALGNFVATGQIGAGFRFNEVFGLFRAAPGPFIIVYLLSILTSIIALLGLIACIIGVWFTIAYSTAINAHLWGQAYREAKTVQGMPVAPSM